MRSRSFSFVVTAVAAALAIAAALARASMAADPAPLAEVQVIALPDVARRIDHLAVDPAGKRLFVAALGNGTLEVLDLAAGRRTGRITGLREPQGVAFVAAARRIVVAMRGGGVGVYEDAAAFPRAAFLPPMPDADNLRLDAANGQLWVGFGEGALAAIDPAAAATTGAPIRLPGHPESFRLEEGSARAFVNVPDSHEIVIVDRAARAIVQHLPLPDAADNYPMSLDERGHRLFVAARHPAELLVIDTASGKRLAAMPCVGDSDDLFYDARRDRVYVIGGEGFVDVVDARAGGSYPRIARLATRDGARTGLFSPELDRLFVAWPRRGDHAAQVQVLAPR